MALSMMIRGIPVDIGTRDKLIFEFRARYRRLDGYILQMVEALGFTPSSEKFARSPKQLIEFFYSHMHITPITETYRGVTKVKMDRPALEKIQKHPHAGIIAKTILAQRDIHGQIKVLATDLDSDGRMRFSFNPSGTETGRWSSQGSPIHGGTQGQNITDEMRRIFIPPGGFILVQYDLAQAESRGVGYYSDDQAYIEACESGDLHSKVCEMVWPGTDPKQSYYRHLSRRDICKRCGHGSNYDGTPFGIADAIGGGITTELIASFQKDYFAKFSGIKRWHLRVAQELGKNGYLETVFGFRRQFFNRLWADDTRKEAIAFLPQSTIAYYMNKGLWSVFLTYDRGDPNADVQIVSQGHDSGLMFVRESRLDLIPKIRELLDLSVLFPSGKIMRIPTDCAMGYNWGKVIKDKAGNVIANGNGLDESLEGKSLVLGNVLDAVL
jgi:DNA polymerase-1